MMGVCGMKNCERDVWKVKSTLFVPGYHGSGQRACLACGSGQLADNGI